MLLILSFLAGEHKFNGILIVQEIFHTYRRALEPPSILDIASEDLLRSLLQGFHFKNRTGVLLVFNELQESKNHQFSLCQLHPVPVEAERDPAIFNPFCAEFRKNPLSDQACEACDLKRAAFLLRNPEPNRVRYKCHIGIWDMAVPLRLGRVKRAVLFAGQKIVREDAEQIENIRRTLNSEWADVRIGHLLECAEASAEPKAAIDEFEKSFLVFTKTVQNTIDALYLARKSQAIEESALALSRWLNTAT